MFTRYSSSITGPRLNSPAFIVIGLLAVAAATTVGVFGAASLPTAGLVASAGLAAGLVLILRWPSLLAIAVPLLLGLPLVVYFPPAELLLLLVAVVLIWAGVRSGGSWLHRLEPIEIINLLLVLWAGSTLFWSHDLVRYCVGMHRMIVGWIAFWCAYRLVAFVPRTAFDLGLVAGAGSLTMATLHRAVSSGFAQGEASRGGATDLGWGWANYIAALLLVAVPLLVEFAVNGRERVLRVSSWLTLALVFVVQSIIVARGALVMLVLGLAAQVMVMQKRRRLLTLGILAAGLSILLMGPFGSYIVYRFTSARELASGTIRIWYAREGWRRTEEFFPWGMGVHQGWTWPDKLYGLDPHNYWLVLSSELGVPGVALWAVLLALLWRRLSAMARTAGWEGRARALQIVLVISQIHTMTEPNFQGVHYQLFYFWVMGGYLGYWALVRASEPSISTMPR